jgi:hypothetical protein
MFQSPVFFVRLNLFWLCQYARVGVSVGWSCSVECILCWGPGALLLLLGLESDTSNGASTWTLCIRHITNLTAFCSSMTGKVISIRAVMI